MKIQYSLFMRTIASFLIIFVFKSSLSSLYAGNGGPTQPEYAKFQPLNYSDLVNEFDGSFNFSIPVITIPGNDGSGYSMVLNYHSGASPNEQASWVGFGWDLSAGSISREKRGFPDDYKDIKVKNWNETKPNVTKTKEWTFRAEYFSQDGSSDNAPAQAKTLFGLNNFIYDSSSTEDKEVGGMLTFIDELNNYNGVNSSWGVGAGYKNLINAQCLWDEKGNVKVSWDISPSAIYKECSNSESKEKTDDEISLESLYNNTSGSSFASNMSLYFTNSSGINKLTNFANKYSGVRKSFKPAINLKVQALQMKGEVEPDIISFNETVITTKSTETSAYGYYYSGYAESDDVVMDYAVDMESNFDVRDKYLPIPISNYDRFNVKANGIQGSFRAYSPKIGHFRPNKIKNKTAIDEWGVAAGYSTDPPSINFGVDYKTGKNELTISKWKNGTWGNLNIGFGDGSDNDDMYFRFINDIGSINTFYTGTSSFSDITKPVKARIIEDNGLGSYSPVNVANNLASAIGFGNVKPAYFEGMNPGLISSDYSGKERMSSKITAITNKELKKSNNNYLNALNSIADQEKTTQSYIIDDDALTSFSILDKTGSKYIFGKPIFNRNERQLTYGIKNNLYKNPGSTLTENISFYPSTANQNNYSKAFAHITPSNSDGEALFCQGNEANEPYAGVFLLTEIFTADYRDLTGDGPSDDDYGGYTLFKYKKAFRNNSSEKDNIKRDLFVDEWMSNEGYSAEAEEYNDNWYKWRAPHNGFNYARNTISDHEDDKGTVSMGEREVYYIESIETKTHIAYFITNKTNKTIKLRKADGTYEDHVLKGSQFSGECAQRVDAYDASKNEYDCAGNPNSNTFEDSQGNQKNNIMEYLERIELYAKDQDGQSTESVPYLNHKIQTTHFQYDLDYPIWNGMPNSYDAKGKLTLKRVWFENENVKGYGISPYEFEYEYKSHGYPEEYSHLDNYGNGLNQTPDFDPQNIDRWGYYRNDGSYRINEMEEWVSQKEDANFDPAAWNLKLVKLPTGAEMHVHYEQNDYNFVQDKRATVMAKIKDIITGLDKDGEENANPTHAKIFLDLHSELGIVNDTLSTDMDSIKNRFIQDFVNNPDKRIYFKILYALLGDKTGLEYCSNEFIDGYMKVEEDYYPRYEENTADGEYYLTFLVKYAAGEFVPKEICKQYYDNKCNDILKIQECLPEKAVNYPYLDADGLDDIDIDKYEDYPKCKYIDYEHSYMKIPLPINIAKKGGGIRVKRVLFYDKFNEFDENGKAEIFGTEYVYKTEDGYSSGVATNEPQIGREDNALVDHLDKRNEDERDNGGLVDWSLNSLSYGPADMEEFEGPLGESVLPGASVAYSRILQMSIVQGKNNGGILEKQYYTCKDFPFSKGVNNTNMDMYQPYILPIPPPFMVKSNHYFASQGYQFYLNRMHGQAKKTITWEGIGYNQETKESISKSNDWSLISTTDYEYFDFDESIPVYNHADKTISHEYLGTDVEIFCESRSSEDYTRITGGEGDIGFPLVSFIPNEYGIGLNNSIIDLEMNTHVTSKIIQQPVFQKRVITKVDGIERIQENIAFDPYTGAPLITETKSGYDGLVLLDQQSNKHDGSYHNINIPASHEYPELGQASKSTSYTLSSQDNLYFVRRRISEANGKALYHIVIDYYKHDDDIDEETKYTYYTGTSSNSEIYPLLNFSKGDIIKVLPDASPFDSEHYELYSIKDIIGNIMVLEPINSLSNWVSSDQVVDVYIVGNSNTNQLTAPFANILCYGQKSTLNTDKPFGLNPVSMVNSEEMANRQELVDALNDFLRKLDNQDYPNNGIIYMANDPTIMIKDYLGNPFALNNSNINDIIKIERIERATIPGTIMNHRIFINLPGASTAESDFSDYDHPFINDLNAFLNNIFSLRLDLEFPDKFISLDCQEDGMTIIYNISNPDHSKFYEEISDITGLTKILNSVYIINNEAFLGSDLIEKINDQNFEVIYEEATGKALLSDFRMRFKDEPIHIEQNEWWFGIYRKLQLNDSEEADEMSGIFLGEFGNESNIDSYKTNDPTTIATFFNVFELKAYTEYVGSFKINSNGWLIYSADGSEINNDIHNVIDSQCDLWENENLSDNPFTANSCVMNLRWAVTNTLESLFQPLTLDQNTGHILISGEGSPYILSNINQHPHTWSNELECIKFVNEYPHEYEMDGVISASLQTYDNDWEFDTYDYNYEEKNDAWRSLSSYVYKDIVTPGTKEFQDNQKIYSGAIISPENNEKFVLANRNIENSESTKWMKIDEIKAYMPNGRAVESISNPDIISTIKYGMPLGFVSDNTYKRYNSDYPNIVATYANYDNVDFQGWEIYGNHNSTKYTHTGNYSKLLYNRGPEDYFGVIDGLKLSQDMIIKDQYDLENGILCQVWAKTTLMPDGSEENMIETPNCSLYVQLNLYEKNQLTQTIVSNMMDKVCQTGEWTLYETIISNDFGGAFDVSSDHYFDIKIRSARPGSFDQPGVWIDDFRVKSIASSMNCFVFDRYSNKITATLDDSHFATYFQYDDEGNLHRMLKETYRGVFTVSEQNMHSVQTARTFYDNADDVPPLGKIPDIGMKGNIKALDDFRYQKLGKTDDGQIVGTEFGIFELKFNPDHQTYEFFGVDMDSLKKGKVIPNLDDLNLKENAEEIKKSAKEVLDKDIKPLNMDTPKINLKNNLRDNIKNESENLINNQIKMQQEKLEQKQSKIIDSLKSNTKLKVKK